MSVPDIIDQSVAVSHRYSEKNNKTTKLRIRRYRRQKPNSNDKLFLYDKNTYLICRTTRTYHVC